MCEKCHPELYDWYVTKASHLISVGVTELADKFIQLALELENMECGERMDFTREGSDE